MLGQLIDMVTDIKVDDAKSRAKDVLWCVYENILSQFASTEGKRRWRVLHAALRGKAARRYVGIAPQKEDDEPFSDKMQRLVTEMREKQKEAARLDAAIASNLESLGFGPTQK